MNTTQNNISQFRSSYNQINNNFRPRARDTQANGRFTTLNRFDSYAAHEVNEPGIYSPRDFRGQSSCNNQCPTTSNRSTGNSCSTRPGRRGAWGVAMNNRTPQAPQGPRQTRQEAINQNLTNAFNEYGKAFPQGANAVERLAGDKDRSTLVDLLGKNELVGAVQDLEKKGPVTILAPSNKAFADLAQKNPELFGKLTDPRNKEALQEVLLYHVSNQRTDFASGGTFDSLLPKDGAQFFGSPFGGTIQNGDQKINTGIATVSANGSVVIPVDQVLIPAGFDPSKLV